MLTSNDTALYCHMVLYQVVTNSNDLKKNQAINRTLKMLNFIRTPLKNASLTSKS